MDNLQELSNQLDSIKTKLTDKEYKDLMELSKKIYDKKDKKYVKCLVGQIKLNIYEKDNEQDVEMYILGNIKKEIEVVEKIYEITDDYPGMIVLGENSMNKESYEALKKNKYENNDNNDVLVYLGDM